MFINLFPKTKNVFLKFLSTDEELKNKNKTKNNEMKIPRLGQILRKICDYCFVIARTAFSVRDAMAAKLHNSSNSTTIN